MIQDNAVVVFQGDSITDWMRDREDENSMGAGYAFMASALFYSLYPQKNVKFFNRGISGDRVRDLKARWQKDCIDLTPTVVSVFIGVNDTWRMFDSNDPTSVEDFESDYRYILDRVKETGSEIVICEPYLIEGVKSERTPNKETWRADLDPKIHVVRKLAMEYKAVYIPYDGIFAGACTKRDPLYWSYDGVHPTSAGISLITLEWLKAVQGISIKPR